MNVRVKRVSPSNLEVTWDVPPMAAALGIVGYTVFYTPHVTPDVEQWPSVEAGPVSTVTIGKVEPRSVYAAAVRSKSTDGRYSSMSRIAVDNKLGRFGWRSLMELISVLVQQIVYWASKNVFFFKYLL